MLKLTRTKYFNYFGLQQTTLFLALKMGVRVIALLLRTQEVLGSNLNWDANCRRVGTGKPDIIFKVIRDNVA